MGLTYESLLETSEAELRKWAANPRRRVLVNKVLHERSELLHNKRTYPQFKKKRRRKRKGH